MNDRLQIGLLGCGGFARRHAQNLQLLGDEVALVAFCNRTLAKAADFAARYGTKDAAVFADHHAMLAQVPLDALVVTLPPYAHSDEVALAAERGVHVFIEKPIALRSEDGWRMVAAAERAGIVTQVGFMYRFGTAVETLKALIDNGTAGPVGLMTARYFCNALHAPWWRMRDKSGGQFVEQVIHLVDLMRYLMGDPISAYARQANLFHRDTPGYTVEDVGAAIYGFPTGAIGVIAASNAAIPNRWDHDYRIVTQNLTAEFAHANQATVTFTADPERAPLVIAADRNIHLAAMQDFLQAIRTGSQTRTPLREGAMSLDMALAANRSAVEHAEVSLA